MQAIPPYVASVVADQPLGYWRLGDAAVNGNTAAQDTSRNGRHGTVAASGVVRGIAADALDNDDDRAMRFDGVSGHVTLPQGFNDFSSGLTIEAWVTPIAATDSARIVELGRGTAGDRLVLGRSGLSNDLVLQVYRGTTFVGQIAAPGVLQPSTPEDPARWRHVAATVDAIGNVTLYANGQVVAVGLLSQMPNVVARTMNAIGRGYAGPTGYFAGDIDEVAIYATNLSEERIRAHYAASGRASAPLPAPTAYQQVVLADAPMAYWGLGDPAASLVARDLTPAGRHAALVNGAALQADGATPGDAAVALDGTNDHLVLPAGFSAFPNGLSVEAWIYPTAYQNWQRIADLGNGAGNDNILFAFNGTTNDLQFDILRGSASTGAVIARGYLQLDRWQHVAATVDAAGLATIYYNGRPVAVKQLTISPASPIPAVVRTKSYLGRSNWSADAFYKGRLDEVAIYAAPLTEARVQEHYEASGRVLPALPPPDAWRGSYYPNLSFIGDPGAVHGNDADANGNIDFNWNTAAPDPAVPADTFAVRWERILTFDRACRRFHTVHNDGMRAYVDGKEVYWSWSDQGGTDRFTDVCAGIGDHVMRVEFYDRTGPARSLFRLVPPDLTGSITPDGGPVTLSFVAGQNAGLTFASAAGQRISLGLWSSLGGCCNNGTVAITRPNPTPGQPPIAVVNPVGFHTVTGGIFLDAVTLPVADTYTVAIDPAGAITGQVTIRLYGVPADLDETINRDERVDRAIANDATTGDPGRNARLTFPVPPARRVSVSVWSSLLPIAPNGGAPANTNNGTVALTCPDPANPGGPALTVVGATSFSTVTGGVFLDALTLPNVAACTLTIDPQQSNAGNFAVQVYTVPDDVGQAATIGGATVSVTAATPGQNARVTFAGQPGQRVNLTVWSGLLPAGPNAGTPGNTSNATVTVSYVDAAGVTRVIAGPTTINTVSGNTAIGPITLPADAPADATYTVTIDPARANVGEVRVTLAQAP